MSRRFQLFLAILVCMLGTNVLLAQEKAQEPERELYFIYKEHVKPSMMKQYEAAVKEMIQALESYQISPEKVSFHTVFGPEIGYVYVMKLENYGSMDTMRENWMAAVDKVGKDRWTEIIGRADECVDHAESHIVARRPELSYQPESPSVDPTEVEFLKYGFYYALPGHEQEIEEIAKKFVKLYEKHGITTGYSVYQMATGSDLPAYAVIHAGRGELELANTIDEIETTLGAENQKLGEQVMQHMRRIERTEGWIRPDLSYPSEHPKK